MTLILNIIKTIILAIVEGITEWLPISSSGHLILLNKFLKLDVSNEFWLLFFVVIQLGAIFAVIVLYFNKLNPFAPSKSPKEKKTTWEIWFKVAIATLPLFIIFFSKKITGVDIKDLVENTLSNPIYIVLALIIYGILFIVIEILHKDKRPTITTFKSLGYSQAFIIGVFQSLAIIPGTSRSGSTILGGLLIGCSRFIATEFSFFMAIPAMFGTSILKLKDFGWKYSVSEIIILITGVTVSFVVSIIAIKFLLSYLKKHDLKVFGVYRIVLGLVLLICIFAGVL